MLQHWKLEQFSVDRCILFHLLFKHFIVKVCHVIDEDRNTMKTRVGRSVIADYPISWIVYASI